MAKSGVVVEVKTQLAVYGGQTMEAECQTLNGVCKFEAGLKDEWSVCDLPRVQASRGRTDTNWLRLVALFEVCSLRVLTGSLNSNVLRDHIAK